MTNKNEKISLRQLFVIIFITWLSPVIRLIPQRTAETAKAAAWLTPVAAIVPMILLLWIINALFKNQKEGIGLYDIIVKALGTWPGRIVAVAYLLWTALLPALLLRLIGERFLQTTYKYNPVEFFIVLISILIFFLVRGKYIYMARAAETSFLLLGIAFALFALFSLNNVNPEYLLPVSYLDAFPVAKGSLAILGIVGNVTYAAFIFKVVKRQQGDNGFFKQGVKWSVYFCITLLVLLIIIIGTLGPDIASRAQIPIYPVAKNINLVRTFDRIESVVIAIWSVTDVVFIWVSVMIVVEIIKGLFGLKEVRRIVAPIIFLEFSLSMILAVSGFDLEKLSAKVVQPVNLAFEFIVPVFVLLIGKLRHKI